MDRKKKIGLVVEGGGMKCAYNAGILDGFLDHGILFDYCIGVSGGAGNAASYVAGQRGRNIRFFTEHIHSPKYFGIRSLLATGNLFGLQYIYGELTNSGGKDPLDFAAIMKSPAEYEVVATNALTGEARYFGKEEMKQDDYRPIMASSAIPAAYRPVVIDGVPYYDGGIADVIPVRHALEKGCDRLVVILSKRRDYVRKLGTYSMDEETEKKLYDLGMKDFKDQLDALHQFIYSRTVRDSAHLNSPEKDKNG